MHVDFGVEIHHDGDLPARSGLGSSSSFTVGLLNALYALDNRMVTKHHLAEQAIHIEQEVIAESVGSQDQIWASYGGMNRIEFQPDNTFNVQPIIMSPERRQALLGSFLLFFTGHSRIASDIASRKIMNLSQKQAHIRRMMKMVGESEAILTDDRNELSDIGTLLDEAWCLKRELADGITNSEIDDIYETACAAGANGGKLLGAGGGGFVLVQAPPERHAKIRDALRKLICVELDVDMTGSKVVVYEPDGLDTR